MLLDKSERIAISYLPWCDDRTIWSLDIETGLVERIPFASDSKLSFHTGEGGMFSVGQLLVKDGIFRVTVHSAAKPAAQLARVDVSGAKAHFAGDLTLWSFVPKTYLVYMTSPSPAVSLIIVNPAKETVDVHVPNLTDTPHDDPGYRFGEGYFGVAQVYGQDLILILRNKESNAIIYDLISRKTVGDVWFGKRGGNLDPHFRRKVPHVLSVAYDRLVVLNYIDWSIVYSQQLQPEDAGVGQPMGCLFVNEDESRCVVTRPYSSDVLVISMKDYAVERVISTVGNPYDVALLSSGRVICRDFQTCRYLDWPILHL